MICTDCEIEKPLTAFYFRKDNAKYRTNCKVCHAFRAARWFADNPDKRRAIKARWAKAHAPYLNGLKAKYRALDPLRMRKWSIENPERMQACRKSWHDRNRHRVTANLQKRRARAKHAVPKWADHKKIEAIYQQARSMGKLYEVDHIVPMQGRTVCGLHCEDNLQIITQRENRQKLHFRWPDMP